MTKVKSNLSQIVSSIGKKNFIPSSKGQIGKVYGVVTTENTPTPEMFKKAGGFSGTGTVFYLNYEQAKKVTGSIDNTFLNACQTAIPKDPQSKYYPVIGELIFLESGPSFLSQVFKATSQKYYSLINLWNNQQQNSQRINENDILGSTLSENPNARPLIFYQGDNILGGRQGSSLRFSTTTKGVVPPNEWSLVGNTIDPITILTNGLAYNPDNPYYIEQINKDASSIYLTSAQKIPLQTDKTGILNSLTNPISVSEYFSSQVILNVDRIVLNSKKDEVMLFAKTNIELNTKNIINLNADERIHLNSERIFLGTVDNKLPTEPMVLGNKLDILLEDLISCLKSFSIALTTIIASPEGSCITDLNRASQIFLNKLEDIDKQTENILSSKSFTA